MSRAEVKRAYPQPRYPKEPESSLGRTRLLPMLPASKALRASLILLGGLVLIAVIGVIDHDTGEDLSIVLFYLLPVFLVAWYLGLGAGLVTALSATVTWYLANSLPHLWTWRIGWNVGEKLTVFTLLAVMAVRLKRSAVAVYQRELEIGSEVQRGLFPRSLPATAGLEIAARLIPNQALSGDYYDFFPRDRCVGFAMADVMGKGLAASLLTANLHALLHFNELQSSSSPMAALLGTIHRHLRQHSPGRYVTMVLASIAAGGEDLTYAVAGHPPPLLWNGTAAVRLEATGLPVGLLAASHWGTRQIGFPPGALFVAYTDGVSEAVDAGGREYGIGRLEHVVESLGRSGATAEEAVEVLLANLRAWTGENEWADDVAVVAVRNCKNS